MNAAHLLSLPAPQLATFAAAEWESQRLRGRGVRLGAGMMERSELVLAAASDRDVAVYRDADGAALLVGQADGPWAVWVGP